MKELVCIVCPKGCRLKVYDEENFRVEGNSCPRGEAYGKDELRNPTRVLTSTVRIKKGVHLRLPVKTEKAIPKEKLFDAMKQLDQVEVTAPVQLGQVIIEDICGTGVSVIASRSMEERDEI